MDEAKAQAMKAEVRDGWTREAVGWVKHAALIEEWTRDANALIIKGAGAKPGDRVLDVASGVGDTAFAMAAVVGPRGHITGSDLVPAMVRGAEASARRRGLRNVDFQEADAEALPFPDRAFDAVTCRHGVMFFPRAEQALREFRRVLRPGGQATLLAWGPPEGNPFLGTVGGPYLRRMGPAPPGGGDAPGPFRFAAPGSLSEVLRSAGFEHVRDEARVVPWDFPGDPATFWADVQEITSDLFGWFRAELPPKAFEEASAEVQAEARRRYDGKKVRFTATMVLATGRRPG